MNNCKSSLLVFWLFSIQAFAEPVGDLTSFSAGEVISSSAMNKNFQDIKTAVDGTDAELNVVKTQLDSVTTGLQDLTAAARECLGNNPLDQMVRVGTLCVDKHKASIWSSTTADAVEVSAIIEPCANDGTGCAGIVAQSRETPGAALANRISYARAQVACANADKRLLTPAEWLLATSSADISDMLNIDELEYVQGVKETTTRGEKLLVGYMGRRAAANNELQYLINVNIDDPSTDYDWLGFRCAR